MEFLDDLGKISLQSSYEQLVRLFTNQGNSRTVNQRKSLEEWDV